MRVRRRSGRPGDRTHAVGQSGAPLTVACVWRETDRHGDGSCCMSARHKSFIRLLFIACHVVVHFVRQLFGLINRSFSFVGTPKLCSVTWVTVDLCDCPVTVSVIFVMHV